MENALQKTDGMILSHPVSWFGKFLILIIFTACGETDKPLDAQTRREIDSISAIQIRLVRAQIDSICQIQRQTILPKLVDSIKIERLQEIQEALKNVPK